MLINVVHISSPVVSTRWEATGSLASFGTDFIPSLSIIRSLSFSTAMSKMYSPSLCTSVSSPVARCFLTIRPSPLFFEIYSVANNVLSFTYYDGYYNNESIFFSSSSSISSLFLFSSHIKQLTNTKNKFTLMNVNGVVDAIKERKACDWWHPTCYIGYKIKGALDNFSLISRFFSKKLKFLYH